MAGSDLQALEQAVIDNPYDDDVRLELAAALTAAGDPRGEFISAQVEMRRLPASRREERRALDARAHKLLKANRRAWVPAVARLVDSYTYRGGFPEQIKCSMATFIDSHDEIFEQTPVRYLVATHVDDPPALFACPAIKRLRAIEVSNSKIGDAGAVAIANSPYVVDLRWLGLSFCDIGADGLDAITGSEYLDNLRYLGFRGNRVPDPAPRPGGVDFSGYVHDVHIPPERQALIDRFGEKAWLTIDPLKLAAWPPAMDEV